MNERTRYLMYGPYCGQMGWTWSDIGKGALNIGKSAINIFSTAQQTEAYKTLAEQQAAERQAFINNLIKFGSIIAIGIVAAKALRGAK